jgi:hypothetical protein
MPLPDTINTTYIPGGPPLIQAQDLNDLQTWTKEAWSIIRHASVWIDEDFVSTLAASGVTTRHFTDSAVGDVFSLVNDAANGANGAAQWSYPAGHASGLTNRDGTFAFGQSDIYYECRCRVPSIGGSGSNVQFGPAGGLGNVFFLNYNPSANGNSNWWLNYGPVGGPTKVDTNIAVATSSYQKISVIRTAGVITVLNNGNQGVTLSPAAFNIDGGFVTIAGATQTSGTTTFFCDYFRLWSRTAR